MSVHLPYTIDPDVNRFHRYETLWKEVALDLLKAREPDVKGWSLLDYGCGRGETMGLAKDLGMAPTGTDIDPECVRMAQTFGEGIVLKIGDPLEQFGPDSFDVISCFHVLEHVPRPMETLAALGKIARKYLLVAVPNLSRPQDMFRRRNWDVDINEGHLQSWDHSHFRNMVERHCGLKVLKWGFDATVVPPFSNITTKLFGQKAALKLETGPFVKIWPYGSISVIALLERA